jgi:hypothetical protein
MLWSLLISAVKMPLSIGPWSNTPVPALGTLNACLQSGFETFPATRFHGTLHDMKM